MREAEDIHRREAAVREPPAVSGRNTERKRPEERSQTDRDNDVKLLIQIFIIVRFHPLEAAEADEHELRGEAYSFKSGIIRSSSLPAGPVQHEIGRAHV